MVQQNSDPYTVLGVSPEASQAEITHAYRSRVRALHPDARIAAAQTTAVADAQFLGVLAAYAQLRHPDATSITQTRVSDAPVPSTCIPTSSGGVRIPVIRREEHAQEPPAERPPLWAGPVRRHRKSVDGR
jgi:DnaJ-domain-containing protein 1